MACVLPRLIRIKADHLDVQMLCRLKVVKVWVLGHINVGVIPLPPKVIQRGVN